jgi:hypothetical protein
MSHNGPTTFFPHLFLKVIKSESTFQCAIRYWNDHVARHDVACESLDCLRVC